MSFEQELKREIAGVEAVLESFLPAEEGPQKIVLEAMNYSFRAGGKRLRPLLMREVYRAFGGTESVVEPFMAAIEMVHTYSLIHDDLPAMDNDDYRRGKKTCHTVYGEDVAILAGDGLLNAAFETACQAFDAQTETDRIIRSLKILADRAGRYGMIAGQTIDVIHDGKPLNEELLLIMYREKTGALLCASMVIGAILAGASDADAAEIEQAAYEIGLAFQIRDDILDCTGTEETLGKPIHSDERNEKTTYVTLFGLSESQKKVTELTDAAVGRLLKYSPEDSFLLRLVAWLIGREY